MKRTVPEALDGARDGGEFADILAGFFNAVEQARDEEQDQ